MPQGNETLIRVNGCHEPLRASTVAALLEARQIDPTARGVAVALNGTVVPRSSWSQTPLTPGDAVEIVRAMSGG